MPSLLKRVNPDQSDTIWINLPMALWRFQFDKPDIVWQEGQNAGYRARFKLQLTEAERQRLKTEFPFDPRQYAGKEVQQSYRVEYRAGLTLGYFKKGVFTSTKLLDILAPAFGSQQEKQFRDWIEKGGGPPRPKDPETTEEDIEAIANWLGWWEGLEVYGSIRHENDKNDKSKIWSRFGGPMAVGSLPGMKDDQYQAHGLGKLRAIKLEAEGIEQRAATTVAADPPPAVRYTAQGQEVIDGDDVPF